ncbi:MAG TPA: cytochrome c [Puia sp.]|nr:cytochrome c [Puia sp.]
MRAVRFCLLLSLAGVLSCNNPGPANRPTAGDALPSTILDIDVSRDTTVTTPGGAILKIPVGALDAGGATTVKLEVKEAFLLEDMVRGKLFTRSDDQLLSSGGMIYINAAAGQSVTIHQPITVMIPTTAVQAGMMVYDGQADTGGNMNWINPRPLADVSSGGSEGDGKTIFETNCAACHGMKDEMNGPPLAWITSRRDGRWLADFIRNNARMLWRGDAYSCFLFNRYKKAAMPVAHLSDEDVDHLLVYIRHASQGIDSNSVPDLKRTFDSCATADPYCDGAPARTSTDYTQPKSNAIATSNVPASGGMNGTAGTNYYGFTLDKFGWDGIGISQRELPGVAESQLMVKVKGAYHEKTEVFLGIPSLKLLEKGTFAADKNEYYFYTPDGKIPLPQGVDAYVVVRTENDGQSMFGKAKWTIGPQQVVTAEPVAMTPEDIAHAIHELPFDSSAVAGTDALDRTGGTGTAATAGSADSTSSGAGADSSGAASSGAASSGAAGDQATGGGPAGAASTGTGSGSSQETVAAVAVGSGTSAARTRRGKRRRALEQARACPCWCDEMDYRKADSIARAAGAQ